MWNPAAEGNVRPVAAPWGREWVRRGAPTRREIVERHYRPHHEPIERWMREALARIEKQHKGIYTLFQYRSSARAVDAVLGA